MNEEKEKQEGKFDFTPEGELLGYISLDQAQVQAIEYAQRNLDFYGPSYDGVRLVWEVVTSEDREDHYEINLAFRPTGRFQGEPGHEQLIFDKTGELRVRQLLDEPIAADVPPASAGAQPVKSQIQSTVMRSPGVGQLTDGIDAEATPVGEEEVTHPKPSFWSRLFRPTRRDNSSYQKVDPTNQSSTSSSETSPGELDDSHADIIPAIGEPASPKNLAPGGPLQSGFAEPGTDVQDFLRRYEIDYLRKRGILLTVRNLLQGKSVYPLIELMKEQNVERLSSSDGTWYLTTNTQFANPRSDEIIKFGLVDELDSLGNVFNYQNVTINPYFLSRQ